MKGELVRILIPSKNLKESSSNPSINYSIEKEQYLLKNLKWFLAKVFLLIVCIGITSILIRYDYQSQLVVMKSEVSSYSDRIQSLEMQVQQFTMQNLLVEKEEEISTPEVAEQKKRVRRSYMNSGNPDTSYSKSEQRYVHRSVQRKSYRNNDYEVESEEPDTDTDIIPDKSSFVTCGDDCGPSQTQATYHRTFQGQSGTRYQNGGNSVTVTFPPIKVHQEHQHVMTSRQQSGSHIQSHSLDYDSGEVLDLGSARRNRNDHPDIAKILQIPSGTLRNSGFVLRGGNDGGPCNVTLLPEPCANAGRGGTGYNYTYVREYSEGIPGARNFSEESYTPSRSRQHGTIKTGYRQSQSTFDETKRQEEIQRQRQEEVLRQVEIRRQQEEVTRQEQIRQDQLHQEELRRQEEVRRLEEVRRQEQSRQQQINLRQEEETRRLLEIELQEEEIRRQEQLREIEIKRQQEQRHSQRRRPVYTTERPTQVTQQVEHQSQTHRQSHREYHVRQGYQTVTNRYDERQRLTSCRGPNPLAAHYVADKSDYDNTTPRALYDINHSYVNEIFKSWKAADWMTGVFDEDNRYNFVLSPAGTLTVRKAGLYYIYAQIYFEEESHLTGFTIEVNSEPFLQCAHLNEVYAGQQGGSKSNSCFSAGMRFINADDQIVIKDNSGRTFSVFDTNPDKSFFGLMNVGGSCQ